MKKMLYKNLQGKLSFPEIVDRYGSLLYYVNEYTECDSNTFIKTSVAKDSVAGCNIGPRCVLLKELTNEDAIYCIETLRSLGLSDVVKSYNDEFLLMRGRHIKFTMLDKRKIYTPYLWFIKTPLPEGVARFFINSTVPSKGYNYRISWGDFRSALELIIKDPRVKYRFIFSKTDRIKGSNASAIPERLKKFIQAMKQIYIGIEKEDNGQEVFNAYFNKCKENGMIWRIKELYTQWINVGRNKIWLNNEIEKFKGLPYPFTEVDRSSIEDI